MKRLKPVQKEQEPLIPHHGMLPMLPTPPFSSSHFHHHGSLFVLPPEIFFPDTAVSFPFSGSFSTALTCPFIPQTYPIPSTIFAIFPFSLQRAFSTMTASSSPTLPLVFPNVLPTTDLPILTNDTHDQASPAWASIPLLAAIIPLLVPFIHHRIPIPFLSFSLLRYTSSSTSTAIGYVPKRSCVQDASSTSTAIGQAPKRRCVPADKDHAEK
jgi:hypothetical protein